MYAALAGIGAFFVAGGIAQGIGFELWTSGRLVFPFGPPRLEPTLAVGAMFGTFVGFRLGGWRGALGPVLFALAGVIGGLRYFIPYIQCAVGDAALCRYIQDLDFVIPQLWLVPGFFLGVIVALAFRSRIPFRTELEAAGIFGIIGPVQYVLFVLPAYLPFFHRADGGLLYFDQLILLELAVTLMAALFAARLLLRRAARPRQASLVLAIAIVGLALPQVTYQLRYPVDGIELIERFRFFPAALLLFAWTMVWGPRRSATLGERSAASWLSPPTDES